jgi:SAM-dependent methyltransferase
MPPSEITMMVQQAQRVEAVKVAICVWLLSATALSFEVVLTRLLSVVLHYHFCFLAISLALCGLCLGSYLAHLLQSDADKWFRVDLKSVSASYPISILVVPVALFKLLLPLGASIAGNGAIVFIIASIGFITMLPFACVGFMLSTLFRCYGKVSGILYATDLFGASCGCIIAIWLLNALGGINSTLMIALIASVPSLLLRGVFASHSGVGGRLSLAVLVFVSLFALSNMFLKPPLIDIPKLKQTHGILIKPLWAELAEGGQHQKIVWTKWDAFGRTDLVISELDNSIAYIYTDGHNPSIMLKFDGDLNKMREWKRFIGFLPYRLRKPEKVLCLGSGGGLDVLLALLGGAKHIDAVDVNPALPELMRQFKDFNGGIYDMDCVRFFVCDGRSFVKRSKERYDLLFSALTQTAAVGGIGVALVESFIHTVEACRDYIEALSEDGMLAMLFQEPKLVLRWWVTAIEALHQVTGKHEKECALHTAVMSVKRQVMLATPYRYIVLVSKSPFSEGERLAMLKVAKDLGLEVLFIPMLVETDPFDLLRTGDMSLQEIIGRFSSLANIEPATDDSPFFLDLHVGIPFTLYILLAFAVALFFAFIPSALLVERKRFGKPNTLYGYFSIATFYFGFLGMGYMLIEVALLQRLSMPLTTPTHALSMLLSSLLIGSALGSALSQRFQEHGQLMKLVSLSSVLVAVVGICWFFFVVRCVEWLFRFGDMQRMLLLSLLLIATGVPMGMPFPTGLRLLSKMCPTLIPYSWGVNGVTSVLGSITAVMLGKVYGFSYAALVGGSLYMLIALASFVLSHINFCRHSTV